MGRKYVLPIMFFICSWFGFAQVWGGSPGFNPVEGNTRNHSNIIIFGATRGVGLELAKLLVKRGDKVTAFVRTSSDRSALEPLGVEFTTGDALIMEQVEAAFKGKRFSAVVTTLGCFRCDTPPDYIGNKHVFDAANATGHTRVIMVSTLGTGDTLEVTPWPASWILKDVIALKDQAEKHLMSLHNDYTIIRPGPLRDGEATGKGQLTEVAKVGIINRSDLAALIVRCLEDDSSRGKAYVAYDTGKSYPWDLF
jgi:uncharacterized protein YbjT (DUF2867 family)